MPARTKVGARRKRAGGLQRRFQRREDGVGVGDDVGYMKRLAGNFRDRRVEQRQDRAGEIAAMDLAARPGGDILAASFLLRNMAR